MKLYSLFHLRDSGRTHISLWCSMLRGVSFISFPQPALSMSVVLGGCLCFHNTLSQSPENSCGLVVFSWALDTGRWRMQWWYGLWKDKNLILVEKKRAMSFLLHYTLVYWNCYWWYLRLFYDEFLLSRSMITDAKWLYSFFIITRDWSPICYWSFETALSAFWHSLTVFDYSENINARRKWNNS